MIADGHNFVANVITDRDFHCVGTPLQLKLFCIETISSGKKMRVCFDLHGTLVTDPTVPGDYKTVKPISKNIEYLKFLKSLHHEIIIYTARRMKTHGGNVGKLLKDIGKITIDSLDEFGIPYDELYFGKPYADYYVDDKAINVYTDLEKEFGIYTSKISERSFNHITTTNMEVVVKKGRMDKLVGEIYWYKNIHPTVIDLFPSFIKEEKDGYVVEKINGITLSHIYLKESLTPDLLLSYLNSLDRLHHLPVVDQDINIYDNYSAKIKARYADYDYGHLKDSREIYETLTTYFDKYQLDRQGIVGVVHGDPVFSNALMTRDYTFKFIDMRGKLGDKCSTYGDVFYDYAKVYQSLIGYDEILLDKAVNVNYKNKLINIFNAYVAEKYGQDSLTKIHMICNSLLFTLIPLHDNDKCQAYYTLISFS